MPLDHWSRVQEIFLAAVDLPAVEQRRFLDTACGGDSALAEEVETLLASDRKRGSAIAAAVEEEASLVMDREGLDSDRLGPYRIIGEIGRGGMGTVFLALRDDDQFRKNVAIKVVKRGMDTREVLRRFRHERQILANLDHPYIARLLDAGSTPDGRPFFVMDYVEGRPVDVFARGKDLDVLARCELFLRILDAVAYAHRSLVVHLDLKPANILVTAEGSPRLLDFGVAKLASQEGGLTMTSTVRPFTPEYASPEQVRGEPVSTATDIYALGAVFYELLTGQRAQPVSGPALLEIQKAVCETQAPRPSSAAPGLDADLDNIVLMAMRKEPERRYRSVDQLAEDIRRHLSGRTVTARPDTAGYRLRKFARRNRFEIAGVSAVAVSLVFGLGMAISQSRRAEGQRRIAENERAYAQAQSRVAESARASESEQRMAAGRERDAAVEERRKAEERLDQMVSMLEGILWRHQQAISKLPGSTEVRRQMVSDAVELLQKIEKEGGGDERLRYTLSGAYLKLGDVQGNGYGASLGDYAHAQQSYQKAEELIAPLYRAKPDVPDVLLRWIDIETAVAESLVRSSKRAEGIKVYLTLPPLNRKLNRLRPNDPVAIVSEGLDEQRVAVAIESDDPAAALKHALRSSELYAQLTRMEPNDPQRKIQLGSGLALVASCYLATGKVEEAAQYYRRSIDMREPLLQTLTANVELQQDMLVLYGNYATILGVPMNVNLGRYDEARTYVVKSLEIARKMAAADPEDFNAHYNLAVVLARMAMVGPDPELQGPDRASAAATMVYLQESLAMMEPIAKGNAQTFKVMRQVGAARWYAAARMESMGQIAAAEAQLRQGLAEAEPFVTARSEPMITQAISDLRLLALMEARQGKRASAIETAGQAVDLSQRWLEKSPAVENAKIAVFRAMVAMASVHATLGDSVEAGLWAAKALEAGAKLSDGGKGSRLVGYTEKAQAMVAPAAR